AAATRRHRAPVRRSRGRRAAAGPEAPRWTGWTAAGSTAAGPPAIAPGPRAAVTPALPERPGPRRPAAAGPAGRSTRVRRPRSAPPGWATGDRPGPRAGSAGR